MALDFLAGDFFLDFFFESGSEDEDEDDDDDFDEEDEEDEDEDEEDEEAWKSNCQENPNDISTLLTSTIT